MFLLQAEELGLLGIVFQAASQLAYQNTRFTKGPSFPTDERQAAITICNKYLRADILCLIVETEGYLTLWSESKKNINLPAQQPAIPSSDSAKYQNALTSPHCQLKTANSQVNTVTSKTDALNPSLPQPVAKNKKFSAVS